MDSHIRKLSPEELIPELLPLLDQAESVPLTISGNSMSPFLVHGRDTVFLSKVTRPLKKGDMILYRRRNGQYVLHRICRVHPDCYDLVGDAQTRIEPGIRPEQVLATVAAVRRKGKLVKPGHPIWVFYEKIWIRLIRGRGRLLRLYRRLRPGTASMEHKT